MIRPQHHRLAARCPALAENLLMELASVIHDPVTTTDELIPSGETSSYRSNPLQLAEFALSRRDPRLRAAAPRPSPALESRAVGQSGSLTARSAGRAGRRCDGAGEDRPSSAPVVFANKPGDGSAREQAASCQRVLGGCANICYEFATKRYRSNCINWGMLPFTLDAGHDV